MKKRGVLETVPVKTKKAGKIITAQTFNEILVLNCYENKKMIARYCMSRLDNQYEAMVEGKWVQQKLYSIFGYSNWNYNDANKKIGFNSQEDEEVIDLFFGRKCDLPLREIDNRESSYLREKADTKYKRKVKRIEDLMDLVPVLPDDFEEWSNRVIFMSEEFMFFDKEKDTYFCTACGKEHSIKNLKHNEKRICENTGREVVVKRRQQSIKKKERCMVVQNMDTDRSVARHFLVEKEWTMVGSSYEAYEEVRYILSKDGSKRVSWYYGQYNKADEFSQDWWDTNIGGKHCYLEYCYQGSCKEALENTVYENMFIPLMAEKGWKLQYNKVMANHDMCDFLEYMVKGNFERLTAEISDNFSTWGGYYGDLLDLRGDNVSDIFQVDMQRVNRLRHRNGGKMYLEWLQWEEMNRSLPEDTIQWYEKKNISPDEISFILDRMSPVQVANYLKRQEEESRKSISYLLGIWKDYLSMAKRIKMDTNDEIVFRTKNLLQRHDELVETINQQEEDLAAAEMLDKYPEVDNICSEIYEKYRYEKEQFIISVPRGTRDIMNDGRQLHHCSASSERYFERINNRETFILFLRNTDRPLNAYYTLEIEPNGTVRQKRSEYNRQPEIKEVELFIKEWQKEIQKRLSEDDIRTAKESKRKRIEEMQELQVKNVKLATILTEDLMEAI